MKRFLLLVLLSSSAFGQVAASLNAANQCVSIGALGKATVAISVSGTFSATLQPQATIQGQAAANTQVAPSTAPTTLQSTITTGGIYLEAVAGYTTTQLCVSAYTSGTAVVYLNASENQLGSTIGGGGGGGGSAFNAITSGTNTTATMVVGAGATFANANMPDGSLGNASLGFATIAGAGLFNAGGTNKSIQWGDNGNLGSSLWGFNAINEGDFYIIDQAGFWGWSLSADGVCSACFRYESGIISAQTGAASSTPSTGIAATTVNATTSTTSALYATSTNCAATGTAANPSLVACSAAPSGAFSCATNASNTTCVISTTAAHTNSNITVTETSSAGARLGVTCNTAPSATPVVPIASISNGVSFTINMPTITTNPACFFYNIVN